MPAPVASKHLWKHMDAPGSSTHTQRLPRLGDEGAATAREPGGAAYSRLHSFHQKIRKCKLKISCINLYNCQLFPQEKNTEFLRGKNVFIIKVGILVFPFEIFPTVVSFFPFLFEMLLPGSSFVDLSPLPSSLALPGLAQPASCRTVSPGCSPWSSPLFLGELFPHQGLFEGQNTPKFPRSRVPGSCTRGVDRGYSVPPDPRGISSLLPGSAPVPWALTAPTLPSFHCPHVHSAQHDTRTPSPFPSPARDAKAEGHFPGVVGQAAPQSCPVPGRVPQLPLPPGAQ